MGRGRQVCPRGTNSGCEVSPGTGLGKALRIPLTSRALEHLRTSRTEAYFYPDCLSTCEGLRIMAGRSGHTGRETVPAFTSERAVPGGSAFSCTACWWPARPPVFHPGSMPKQKEQPGGWLHTALRLPGCRGTPRPFLLCFLRFLAVRWLQMSLLIGLKHPLAASFIFSLEKVCLPMSL